MTLPAFSGPPPHPIDDRANFRIRGAVWNAEMYNFALAFIEVAANYEASVTTVINGLGASAWVSGTTYAIGNLRFSPATGLLFRRLTAGAGTTDPASDPTNWALQSVAAPTLVVVGATTQTAVKNAHYEMTAAAASTLTLPASPSVGDWVWVGFTNGRRDNVIARNGSLIMGLAEDVTVNWPYAGVILRYISAGFGWRIFK